MHVGAASNYNVVPLGLVSEPDPRIIGSGKSGESVHCAQCTGALPIGFSLVSQLANSHLLCHVPDPYAYSNMHHTLVQYM